MMPPVRDLTPDEEIEARLRALAATLRGAANGQLPLSTTVCEEAADAIDYLASLILPPSKL
jgi:hypothetical protein